MLGIDEYVDGGGVHTDRPPACTAFDLSCYTFSGDTLYTSRRPSTRRPLFSLHGPNPQRSLILLCRIFMEGTTIQTSNFFFFYTASECVRPYVHACRCAKKHFG